MDWPVLTAEAVESDLRDILQAIENSHVDVHKLDTLVPEAEAVQCSTFLSAADDVFGEALLKKLKNTRLEVQSMKSSLADILTSLDKQDPSQDAISKLSELQNNPILKPPSAVAPVTASQSQDEAKTSPRVSGDSSAMMEQKLSTVKSIVKLDMKDDDFDEKKDLI
jgi:hypothetical protein